MNSSSLKTKTRRFILSENPYLYILPAVILFLAIMGFPTIFSLASSFFNWVGAKRPFEEFIGFQNFIRLVNDKYFYIALKNTIIFTFATIIFQNLFGYILAIIIHFGRFRYSSLIKTIIFFPAILSPIVVSLVWRQMFISDGFFNTLFETLSMDFLVIPWLMQTNLLIWIFAGISIWQYVGYTIIIFYAGLQSINTEVMEAATIDGASFYTIIIKIITPIIKPTIILAVILTALGGFKVFEIVFLFTRGGPLHLTETVTTYMYFLAFDVKGGGLAYYSYANTLIFTSMSIVFLLGFLRIRFTVNRGGTL